MLTDHGKAIGSSIMAGQIPHDGLQPTNDLRRKIGDGERTGMSKGNGKVPPHSKEAEEMVLATCMIDETYISKIASIVTHEKFRDSNRKLIFQEMLSLYRAGKEVNLVTVQDTVKATGKFRGNQLGYYLVGLIELCPSAGLGLSAAKIVWRDWQKREIEKRGYRLAEGDPKQKAQAYAELMEMDLVPPWEKEEGQIKVSSFEAIIADETPPPPQLIGRGLLPAQSILLLSGAPKVGKSLLGLNLGLCLASGQDWFQFQIERAVKVLVIQAEVVRWALKSRLEMMKAGCEFPVPEDSLFLSDPELCDIRTDKGYRRITEAISRVGAEVVIFDPLLHFHTEEEDDNSAMGRVLARFRELAFLGVSVILVHHSRKFSDDSTVSNPRGASAIAGAVDSIMEFRKKEGVITATFDLRYDEAPDEMTFKRNPETLWLERYNPEVEAAHNNAILKLLADTESQGKALVDIVRKIEKEFETSERTARRWVTEFAKIGLITIRGKGPNKNVVLSCNLE